MTNQQTNDSSNPDPTRPMSKNIGIVWFRQDLRIADNPALHAACAACDAIICLFIDDPCDQTVSQLGAASRVWLHHSLESLNQSLQSRGTELKIAQGDPIEILQQLSATYSANRLFWNRCYDPATIKRDKKIKTALAALSPESFNASLNAEPWETVKADGTPYRVFTPFWRMRAKSLPGTKPLSTPKAIAAAPDTKKRDNLFLHSIDSLALLPEKDWHLGMMSYWKVGEKSAMASLKRFLKNSVHFYANERNIPSVSGTSGLSPHLHFGEISPRQIMHVLTQHKGTLTGLNTDEETFAKEVIWREFAYTLLYHFPQTIKKPLDKRFEKFPWAKNQQKNLRAWQQGMTGVPIVDAGMRELYATGWMHNRVRMVVASYLIKNLLIPWQSGEQWFRDTLVDADLASNVMGWQWAAGSGADAAPYFRIFNPVLQGEKFDSAGEYVRLWVPELTDMPNKFIHKPWELDATERQKFDYPSPLVDLKESRQRALTAFDTIKQPANTE